MFRPCGVIRVGAAYLGLGLAPSERWTCFTDEPIWFQRMMRHQGISWLYLTSQSPFFQAPAVNEVCAPAQVPAS